MSAIIGILIPVFVPLILDFNLLGKNRSGLEWLLNVWMAASLTAYMFLGEGWFLSSHYLRYISVAVLLVFGVISFFQLPANAWQKAQSGTSGWLTLVWYVIPALIFTVLFVNELLGMRYSPPAVNLQFPLKEGRYIFAQAGGTGIVNHHHDAGSQIYAQDILELDEYGRHASEMLPTSLEQYTIFGKPVYSPCAGIVSSVVDGLADLAPGDALDTTHAAGNHLYIDCQNEKVQVLLAHLKQNSVTVKMGDVVKTGEMVGEVGNSGNTTEPHLHIHARTGGDLSELTGGTGVPILYSGKFFVRNDVISE